MNGLFNPDSWMDVFTILAVSGMVAIPSLLAARNHKSIIAVKDQVVNGHSTPMRQDLDRAIAAIDALALNFHGLRRDLADEEQRRRDHIEELRDEVNRKLAR